MLVVGVLCSPVSAHGGKSHGAAVAEAPITGPNARITIVDGWRASGPEIIRFSQGDTVNLEFTSNQADELHLHGYDITLQLAPNQSANLIFTAEHTGRFGYELHKADREIGVIEVYPK